MGLDLLGTPQEMTAFLAFASCGRTDRRAVRINGLASVVPYYRKLTMHVDNVKKIYIKLN